jgi:hypothetical protein
MPISTLLQLLVLIIVLGLVAYIINRLAVEEPWRSIAFAVMAVILILAVIGLVFPLPLLWR